MICGEKWPARRPILVNFVLLIPLLILSRFRLRFSPLKYLLDIYPFCHENQENLQITIASLSPSLLERTLAHILQIWVVYGGTYKLLHEQLAFTIAINGRVIFAYQYDNRGNQETKFRNNRITNHQPFESRESFAPPIMLARSVILVPTK